MDRHIISLCVCLFLLFESGCAHLQSTHLNSAEERAKSVVQKQVEAYNDRDVDAFLSFYSPTVKIYLHPDTLLFEGHEQMRPRYVNLFNDTPDLHCEIVNRIVMGHFVVDHEKVTGYTDGRTVLATAIYEVKDGLIQNVWFIRKE